MTLGEFKAWLEGFEASIATTNHSGGLAAPTPLQWKAIREKIDTISLVVPSAPKQHLGMLDPSRILVGQTGNWFPLKDSAADA